MIKGTITFTGRTFDDVWHALEEAYGRMEGGMLSGHDSNESGSFTFDLSESTEGGDVPRETSEGTCTEGARRPQCYPFHTDDCPYA